MSQSNQPHALASQILTECANFFASNPNAFRYDGMGFCKGTRTSFLNPQNDQWSIPGFVAKLLWEKYNIREANFSHLLVFKRICRGFRLANDIVCTDNADPFLVFYLFQDRNIEETIQALQKASAYIVRHNLDGQLNLTMPSENIKPIQLYI
ncbi:hypothetical protein [Microcystis sp. M26BS1]|nr:hypothetical protein [Microcystis sp. M26BS1]MCA2555765.1 hypothetical protein [Microcystis sp. M43BS1]